ncbi:uncharacterized protein LOC113400646, partial [Vanessa tameamea]|uniref:Uncharacterized protein LOC113400646 n=1 Tax=Vanessa tameamea TaxID=334116 RepID=A0A8B8IIA0_VANTA
WLNNSPLTGTKVTEANVEVFSSHKRSLHQYPRNPNFANVKKNYEPNKQPKCKVSLNSKLVASNEIVLYNAGNISSRSSLYSVPSIEWDHCKFDYPLRTRSLPRQRKRDPSRLYRTRSQSGFINSYIKDPEPIHFHVPRCNSCGTIVNSFSRGIKADTNNKYGSVYFSFDNISQKCIDDVEFNVVKVEETVLPVYKVANQTEFVESQEFNEDNYLGEICNTYPSDNNVTKENTDTKHDVNDLETSNGKKLDSEVDDCVGKQENVYRAEYANNIDQNEELLNITLDSADGEYHSFTEDMDFAEVDYESPVKDLVGKDIRDYSVPIDLYCEDYTKKDVSPTKSPQKRMDLIKTNILEPILEESKSSYDDSSHDKVDKKVECTRDNSVDLEIVTTIADNDTDIFVPDDTNKKLNTQTHKGMCVDDTDRSFIICSRKDRYSSLSASSGNGVSLDSTGEFEKYETVANVITTILYRIDLKVEESDVKNESYEQSSLQSNSEVKCEENENTDSFSITQIVKNIELNVNLSVSTATETSDIDIKESSKVVEAIIYFIFNIAFRICSNKEKCHTKKATKKVVTVVDFEDILSTTSLGWLYFNEDCYKHLHESVEEIKKHENDIEHPSKPNYEFDNDICANESNKSLVEKASKTLVTVVDCEDILSKTSMERLYSKHDKYSQEDNEDTKPKHERTYPTNVIDSDVLDTENKSISNTDLDCKIAAVIDLSLNSDTTTYDQNMAFINDSREVSLTYYEMCKDLNETRAEDVNDHTIDIATEILDRLLERSFRINEFVESRKTFNETYTVETEEMNTAFLVDDFYRSSSPHRDVFDVCTESPIKHASDSFTADDLSLLYDKDDAILGSPFVKAANLLTMSKTVRKGGIKYWVSFDETIPSERRYTRCVPRSKDNPSFLVIDIDKHDSDKLDTNNDESAGEPANVSVDRKENETFTTESASNYNTCDFELSSRLEISDRKEILLYNTRDVNRLHSTWPPYEHTLFYRIMPRFKLSQSLDLS